MSRRNLSSNEAVQNANAAEAMLSLIDSSGGYFGLPTQNRLGNFAHILHADPDDDLSGLRLLAERMQPDDASFRVTGAPPNDLLDSAAAGWWLLRHRGAKEDAEGNIILDEHADHLALAALAIANSDEGGVLYDHYLSATDNRAPLSHEIIAKIAESISTGYRLSESE